MNYPGVTFSVDGDFVEQIRGIPKGQLQKFFEDHRQQEYKKLPAYATEDLHIIKTRVQLLTELETLFIEGFKKKVVDKAA